MIPKGFACQELVELVTEYLVHALPPELEAQCDDHLEVCAHCRGYVEQMRQTIRALGTLIEGSTSPATQAELVAAFRTWQQQR